MKYIVYQTVNKVNGKLYIGVHKTENPDVFDRYIGNGIKIGYQLKNPKTVYQYALKKYGYDNFIRTTLYIFNSAEEAFAKEAEIVNIDWVKSDNNYNTCIGGMYSSATKSLYQFDYKGNLIKKWIACFEAEDYYGCCRGRFKIAVDNKRSAFESYWSFNDTIDVKDYRKSVHCELYQFDLNGNLLKVWTSLKEASESLNINCKTISECIMRKKKYKNCWWSHDPDNIYDIIKYNKLFNLNYKAIRQFDSNHNFLQEFNSMKEASSILNIKYGTIKHGVLTKCLVNSQFYFEYVSPISKTTKIKQFDLNGNLIKIWDSISQCAKEHPKCREVLKGVRKQTHGFTFSYILE